MKDYRFIPYEPDKPLELAPDIRTWLPPDRLSLFISDTDLLNAIDRMKSEVGETEIFVKIRSSKSEGGPLGALDQKS